ncbi:MAG: hypothetical protein WCO56_25610 [Verrucomicrobiota bacterium]
MAIPFRVNWRASRAAVFSGIPASIFCSAIFYLPFFANRFFCKSFLLWVRHSDFFRISVFGLRICSLFASIGVIGGLLRIPAPNSQPLPSVHHLFAMFWFRIFLPVHFSAKVGGQRIVIKNSIYHIFITIWCEKSISSQKHHNFQNYTTHPCRSRRRQAAQIKQPPVSQEFMN